MTLPWNCRLMLPPSWAQLASLSKRLISNRILRVLQTRSRSSGYVVVWSAECYRREAAVAGVVVFRSHKTCLPENKNMKNDFYVNEWSNTSQVLHLIACAGFLLFSVVVGISFCLSQSWHWVLSRNGYGCEDTDRLKQYCCEAPCTRAIQIASTFCFSVGQTDSWRSMLCFSVSKSTPNVCLFHL